jgi:type I restriction enzyme S subunit
MSNDWFFEKFALIADAPGAVERMRGLVMWSAFSGAFSDEPRDQPMPEKWAIEGTPTLPPIPSSWSWQRGSDVFDVIRGVSYTKGDSSDTPVDGSFPILRANNIGRGINFNELVYVRAGNIRDEQFVRPGDILIAMSSGSKRLVGKAAPIVTEFQGGFGAFCGVIRNKSNVPDTVLARYFESPQYTSWVTSAGRGIGINNLSKGDLNSLPIPTPPLAEQKRIVTRVDELMGICDALESQQQERDSRKSVLVRSSLSRFAEAPTSENLGYLFHKSYDIPPSELRKSILTLAVQGKLVPFDTEGTEQTVGEHIDFQNGFAFKSQWFTATGTRLCRNVNVSHGFLDWKESVSVDEKVARDFQRFALCEGDIVLSLDRPLIATGLKIARVRQEDLPSLLLQRVARLTPKHEQLSRSYIFLWLNSTAFVDCIDPGRSNGVPHISTRQVQQLAFSVPPLAEQNRIVAKVDQLMALVDELERQQAASRENASKLLDAIVQEMTSDG